MAGNLGATLSKPENSLPAHAFWFGEDQARYVLTVTAGNADKSIAAAKAAGVPVVAFRAGGVPEIIVNNQTGALVHSGDAAALATAVSGLLLDAPRRIAFGAAAREHVAGEFCVADMVSGYLTLYRQLAETPAS